MSTNVYVCARACLLMSECVGRFNKFSLTFAVRLDVKLRVNRDIKMHVGLRVKINRCIRVKRERVNRFAGNPH